jgi:hypothetical protein
MNYKNVIVFSLPRSGTNYFCDTLQKSLPNCINLGEFMHHYNDFKRNIPEKLAIPEKSCFIVNRAYNQNVNTKNIEKILNNFGSKYDSIIIKLQDWGLKNILAHHEEWFKSISNDSLNIFLVRNNILNTVISRLVAVKLNSYTHEQDLECIKKTPNVLNDFIYDYDLLRNEHIDTINRWKWLVKNKPKNCMTISYENIINHESDDWKYLKKKLNINNISEENFFIKQDKTRYESWIQQYTLDNNNSLPLFFKDINFNE